MITEMRHWAEAISKAYDMTAWGHTQRAAEILKQTRNRICAAIAEAEKQEPVGEMKDSQIIEGMVVPVVPVELPAGTKLYAASVKEPLGYWNAVEGWVELPEEAHKPAQAKTIPKWPLKHKWVNGRGYVVWRDVFEGNMKCPLDEAIAAHAQAVFVDEGDAKEYCTFKNTTPPAAQQEPVAWAVFEGWNAHDLYLPQEYDEALKMAGYKGDHAEVKPLYTTPPAAQPAPVQVSPTDFVDMVMDKEDAIGKPIFWAEWPNREKNT